MKILWKILPKSIKMVPRNAPNAFFEAGRFQEGAWGGHPRTFLEPFGATWAILGVILGPAGRQGSPKIELFGTKSHQNLKKLGPEWGIKKYMNI